MKKMNSSQMEVTEGGNDFVCGVAVGFACFAPNPFSIGAALALCLVGDQTH